MQSVTKLARLATALLGAISAATTRGQAPFDIQIGSLQGYWHTRSPHALCPIPKGGQARCTADLASVSLI